MPERVFGMTEQDRDLVQQIIDIVRRRLINQSNRPAFDPDEYYAPDTYIARAPAGGLAGLNTGENTGSGTATAETGDDVPAYAHCPIYKIINDVLIYAGFTIKVHNVSEYDIPAGAWMTIHRDKFGDWVVASMGLKFTRCP